MLHGKENISTEVAKGKRPDLWYCDNINCVVRVRMLEFGKTAVE
jgi:hypothetical protein